MGLNNLFGTPKGALGNDLPPFGCPWIVDTNYRFTLNNFGTVSEYFCRYKREGDTLKVSMSFVAGTPAASPASLTLMPGFTIDTTSGNTKFPQRDKLGLWHVVPQVATEFFNTTNGSGLMIFDGSDTVNLYFSAGSNTTTPATAIRTDANQIVGAGAAVLLDFEVPIYEWKI